MTIEHTYCILDGTEYFDYTLRSHREFSGKNFAPDFLIDTEVHSMLKKPDEFFYFPNIKIPKNTPVYVAPDCPTPVVNIRRNYIVKKNPDDGDYNVIHPYSRGYMKAVSFDNFAVFPSLRAIVASDSRKADDRLNRDYMFEIAKDLIPDADENEMLVYKTYKWMMAPFDSKGVYRRLLDHSFKKPCVTLDALDTADNTMTTDLLRLIYFAGTQSYSNENENSLSLQIEALGQTDWKKYAGTVELLKITMRRKPMFRHMENHKSSYPKAVKEILYNKQDGFCSKADFLMAKKYLSELMRLRRGVMCVSASDFENKLVKFNVSASTFQSLFDCKVRIDNDGYDED